jgi:glycerate kinase
MRILVAPQSFKGSLHGYEVAEAITEGLRTVWPDAEYDLLPVADGGEGTVEALVTATDGAFKESSVEDPLGRSVQATWGILGDGQTGVIEMAAASGLPLISRRERNAKVTSTYGTGQLMRAAIDNGTRRLIIGIGGSATNDGGAGMAYALGARFLDEHGQILRRGGADLLRLDHIDVSGLDPRIRDVEMIVASDVTNPLCGPNGASSVYGPQKGARPADVALLDRALARLAEVIERDLGVSVANEPGGGAAGGLGAGLMAFADARMCRGVELIFQAMNFDSHLDGVEIVFTGEGRVDKQDVFGKAPVVVAERASARGIPTVLVVGSIGAGYESVLDHGVQAIVSILDRPMPIEAAVQHTARMIRQASEQAARLIDVGEKLAR